MGVSLVLWNDWLLVVMVMLTSFVLLYFPLALAQVALIGRWLVRPLRRRIAAPHPGRRLAVVVCTNGKAVASVESLLARLRDYALPQVSLYVLKEAYDAHRYSAAEIVVPADYHTPNGSWTKERALHYGAEWGRRHGWGWETYVVHLDDDSLVSKEYLRYVLGMRGWAGQGSLKLRDHGQHLFSTLADLIRVVDCETYCRWANERGRPVAVHGEGLVLRADVEQSIGWDYATYCGEDFLMGQEVRSRGWGFEHIPYDIYIAPPIRARDFLKQRRRWMWGIFSTAPRMWRRNRRTLVWLLYRYAVGWTGFLGFFLFVYTVIVHIPFPTWLASIALFNMASYFFAYQVGAAKTRWRYMPEVLVLQFAVAMYEGACLPYAMIFRPDRRSFDTVEKPAVS